MKRKRPTEADWRTLIELTVYGHTLEEIAYRMHTPLRTIHLWISNDPARAAQYTYATEHVPEHHGYRRLLYAIFGERVGNLPPPTQRTRSTCTYRHLDGTDCRRQCKQGLDRCRYHLLIALPRPDRQMCRVVDQDDNPCPYVATTNRWQTVVPDDPEFADCLLCPQLCDKHYGSVRRFDEELDRIDSPSATRATCSECERDFMRADGDRSQMCPLCERRTVEGPRPLRDMAG